MKFRGGEFSTGTMGNFQPELTHTEDCGGPSVRPIRVDLPLEGTRLRHRKAMGRSTSHNDGGEARDAAFLRRSSAPPWCSSSFPSCQRGFQLNVNLEQELFGPAASASAVGTCSVTFGSFVLMS